MRKGFLIVASFLLCSHAIAQVSPQDESLEILEQAGCAITGVERDTVSLSCVDDSKMSDTTSLAAASACKPVEADKPVEVTLAREEGENDRRLENRLKRKWDLEAWKACPQEKKEKCTFFEEQEGQGKCLSNGWDSTGEDTHFTTRDGTFSAKPVCKYKCTACGDVVGTPALVQSLDQAF